VDKPVVTLLAAAQHPELLLQVRLALTSPTPQQAVLALL